MFTGIIEEIGTVKGIIKKGKTLTLTIQARTILTDVHLGDSIAVNGVCLTVTHFDSNQFAADVMPETFHSTNLSQLKQNSKVNLERAMSANGRFGGHFVSGHIDGIGKIISIKPVENAVLYKIEIPNHYSKYCLEKGSVTIDGTSLTIFEVDRDSITISLIPHTKTNSIVGEKNVGETVNLEFDLLGKYVERMVGIKETKNNSRITTSFLSENGYL